MNSTCLKAAWRASILDDRTVPVGCLIASERADSASGPLTGNYGYTPQGYLRDVTSSSGAGYSYSFDPATGLESTLQGLGAKGYVFDAQGRAYVSELWWHKGDRRPRQALTTEQPLYGRVSVFDKDGRLLTRWGTPEATASGSFAAPHGIAVDSGGDIYVAEVTWTFAESRGRVPAGCHTFQKFTLKS